MNGAADTGEQPIPVADCAAEAVVVELRRLTRAADRFRHAVHTATGISGTELTALAALAERGPLRAVDVGAATGLTPGSVTALLDRLQARDLVRRTRPEGNKRVLSIEATGPGRVLLAAVLDPVHHAVARLLDADDPTTADILRRCLAALAAEIETLRVPAFAVPAPTS